ncbi:MAG: hypothetical protein NTW03_01205, partial [Verrucomicrobia bacterium]|nr:hypothetical protein [Verrucomicrobiota bacterium]
FHKRYTWLMANAHDSWIRWRCQEEADYFGKAARILTAKRPDLRLIAVIANPHAPVPSDLKQWEAGKRQVELSREAGLDPALIAKQPAVEMIRNIGPADYRWFLSSQPKNKQALMAVRRWYFTDDQLRDYRTTPDIGVWFYHRYFETGLPANPLACSWYRDPGWLATAPSPSGDYYMEDYAHALAVLDPAILVNGGFTLGVQGHLSQVERFARVFRQLPVGAWQEVPGLGGKVTGRTLQVGGQHYLYVVNHSSDKHYLYVVNHSSDKVDVTISAASAGAAMQPLGGSPALTAGKVNLGPFELAAWAAGEQTQ